MKHYKIIVRGRVQGVGFRYTTKQVALSNNIKGYVSNQMDRSVLIHAEGKDTDIDHFVNWCRNGPDWARVEGINISECPATGYDSFSIR